MWHFECVSSHNFHQFFCSLTSAGNFVFIINSFFCFPLPRLIQLLSFRFLFPLSYSVFFFLFLFTFYFSRCWWWLVFFLTVNMRTQKWIIFKFFNQHIFCTSIFFLVFSGVYVPNAVNTTRVSTVFSLNTLRTLSYRQCFFREREKKKTSPSTAVNSTRC